jgi:hypothetical protein
VVERGVAAVVGIGRPMTVQPELPARLLDGSVEVADAFSSRLGIRKFDDALAVLWFQAQIHRMGDGLDPDPKLGKLGVLLRGIFDAVRG